MALVFTIGHSDHSFESLARLLHKHGITAVADVRSVPHSARLPQFNKDELKSTLKYEGIAYVYLGKELGGRPNRSELFCDGVADYEKMAQDSDFKAGLARVIRGAETEKIALMCSERDPLDCHRCLLVGRELARSHIKVTHILADGTALPHESVEDRLLGSGGKNRNDFFATRCELLEIAYRERARRVAFAKPNNQNGARWERSA
jgi:uncharacterized protein (DUF488 family)